MLITYKTILEKKVQLTEDVYLFNFKLIDPPEISFSAGQYMILNVPQSGKEAAKRLYSIASSEIEKNSLEFIVQIVPKGLVSTHLNNLKVGEDVVFEGPAGAFVLRKNENDKVFLATGTGIAPIRSIIISKIKDSAFAKASSFTKVTEDKSADKQKSKIHIKNQNYYLFWGVRYFKDVYLLDELRELTEEQPNFQFKICLSREEGLDMVPEQYRKYFSLGHVDKEIINLCSTPNQNKFGSGQALNNVDFYICGGKDVVESLKQCLVEKGVPQDKIFFEKF